MTFRARAVFFKLSAVIGVIPNGNVATPTRTQRACSLRASARKIAMVGMTGQQSGGRQLTAKILRFEEPHERPGEPINSGE